MSLPEFLRDEREGVMRGVAVGIVTNNEDPEKLSRVKLTFPWREAEDESYWARIATTMAGTERGTYFLPEVGDEVLVGFENGDIHYPYVLGALWNGKEKPPEDNADGRNDVRKIRSRSGHEIVLDDAESEGNVEIRTNAGHRVVLDDSTGREKVSIEDKTGQDRIEFDAVGRSLDITAGAKLSVTAPMIEIKGDASVSVESSGILSLKGAIIKLN